MNLIEKFTQKELGLIKKAGIRLEEKEYSEDELKRCATEIEEYILSHSSKGKEMEKLNNQYASIFSSINRMYRN